MDYNERTLTILLPFQTSSIKIEGENGGFRQFSPRNYVPANDLEIGFLMQDRNENPVKLQFLNSEFLSDAEKQELDNQQNVATCPDDKSSVIIDQNFNVVFEL